MSDAFQFFYQRPPLQGRSCWHVLPVPRCSSTLFRIGCTQVYLHQFVPSDSKTAFGQAVHVKDFVNRRHTGFILIMASVETDENISIFSFRFCLALVVTDGLNDDARKENV